MNDNFAPTDEINEQRRQLVYSLWKKKFPVPEILARVNEDGTFGVVTVADILADIKASRANIKQFADENPHYLDSKLRLILEKIENLEVVCCELWSEFRAVPEEHRTVRAKLLESIQKNEMEQAKLLQLLGNASEVVTKLEQATKAQQELIQVVRDVTSTCPHCANALALKLKNLAVRKEELPPKDATLN